MEQTDKQTNRQTDKQTDIVIYIVDREAPFQHYGYMSAPLPPNCKSLKYVISMLEIVQIYDVSQNVKSLGLLEIIPDNRMLVHC